MTQKERMLKGMLYIADDSELKEMNEYKKNILKEFNDESNIDAVGKQELLKKLFEHFGEGSYVSYPFRCDYGCNISVGKNFYANFDCIFLDVNKIKIGDNVFMAPRVCIYTAGHPIDKDIRNEQLEYGYPVTIGNDVWVGGSVVINPGVTIGDNVVIGSGSVVTKDLPSNTVCAGVPCKVIREITDEDRVYWQKEKDQYMATFSDEK